MDQFRQYQEDIVSFCFNRMYGMKQRGAGVLADPGLGKTWATLELIDRLVNLGVVNRVLITAPLNVAQNVWPDELEKRNYDLRLSVLHGNAKDDLLDLGHTIQVINPEGLKWLRSRVGTKHVWDLLVMDESHMYKNQTAKQSQNIRAIRKFIPKAVILTGSPTPKCLSDFFHQSYLLDGGETFGRHLTHFRQEWMLRTGNPQWNQWTFKANKVKQFYKLLEPLVIRLDAKDHLDLPELVVNDIKFDLPDDARKKYDDMEQKLFAEIGPQTKLFADSAAVAYTKCRQLANGCLYDDSGNSYLVHHKKVQLLENLRDGLYGKQLLVGYAFNLDLENMQTSNTLKTGQVIRGGQTSRTTTRILNQWNDGKIETLLCQPQSTAYGLNLQAGGCNDVAWFGLSDRFVIYDQFIRRVYRQGVSGNKVRVHRFIARDTIDEAITANINQKGNTQQNLLDAINRYRNRLGR